MMTERARQIGMKETNFHNASGLPDPLQITTAQDMATLGRRLAYDYPQHFPFFALAGFNYKGTFYPTHDNLIGRYDGADGIKTGYTGASGFNLVSSVTRGSTHLVAVVMGGRTAVRRDMEMMRLLDQTFAQVAANPTLVAARNVPWTRVASSMAPTQSIPAQISMAQVTSLPSTVQAEDEDAAEQMRAPDENFSLPRAGGTTLAGHSESGALIGATVAPQPKPVPPALPKPATQPAPLKPMPAVPPMVAAATAPPMVAAATKTPMAASATPPVLRVVEAPRPRPRPDMGEAPALVAQANVPAPRPNPALAAAQAQLVKMAVNTPPQPVNAPRPQIRPSLREDVAEGDTDVTPTPGRNWTIQIGAYADKALAAAQLKTYYGKASDVLARASQIISPSQTASGHTLYRARFGLYAEQEARDVCSRLTQRGQTCFAAVQTR